MIEHKMETVSNIQQVDSLSHDKKLNIFWFWSVVWSEQAYGRQLKNGNMQLWNYYFYL